MKYVLVVMLAVAACGGDDGPAYEPEKLMDPATCTSCHQTHHDQWSGSMHAYAATDPIFRAMHKRGQRETNGEMGMLCVNCHAPMAVARGTITEANVKDFDFDTLGPEDNGITCYFCHNVEKVAGDHNNPIQLAMDSTMRAGVRDPAHSPAHRSKYDPLMDNDATTNDSSICGGCHDIVNNQGVEVERTFREWKTTVFATNPDPLGKVSCGSCHMEPKTDVIADGDGLDVGVREFGFHDHTFPAIDQALVPFPQIAEQDAAVKAFLSNTVAIVGPKPRIGSPPGGVCLPPGGNITVRTDAITVGHNFPSGSSFDRRAWVEVIAYDASDNIVYQNGVTPDGMDPDEVTPPPLATFWDKAKKADGKTAHFIWDVASIEPNDSPMTANVLLPAVTLDQNDPRYDHSRTTTFTNIPNSSTIERIEARLLVRSFAYEAIRDLVDSGDLDASFLTKLTTLEVDHSTWLKSTQNPVTKCNPK